MNTEQKEYYTLVTGSSAGLGKRIASTCAEKGFNLFLVSLPDTGLENFAIELREKFPVQVKWLCIDLTRYEAPLDVFNFTRENSIVINNLVNNAGLGHNGKLENLTPLLIDQMILLNIRALTLLSYYFLDDMKKMEKAHILNISSFGAFAPLPFKSIYAASKVYVQYFSQGISRELKGTNISVTSIHPSGISSERALKNIQRSGKIARITTLSPEFVAKVAVDSMLKGTKYVIPGVATKIYYFLGSCLPHGLILRLVGRVFRKA